MTTQTKPPMRFPWPLAIVLCAIIASVAADLAMPLPWFRGPFGELMVGIGALLALGGVVLIAMAIARMRKVGTTVAPYAQAQRLVTDGPFAISRNPIYLGMVAGLAGIGLALSNPWFLVFCVAAGALLSAIAIRPEERHMEQRFGKAWRDYTKRVRRWF